MTVYGEPLKVLRCRQNQSPLSPNNYIHLQVRKKNARLVIARVNSRCIRKENVHTAQITYIHTHKDSSDRIMTRSTSLIAFCVLTSAGWSLSTWFFWHANTPSRQRNASLYRHC